jgi:hypothetical protein
MNAYLIRLTLLGGCDESGKMSIEQEGVSCLATEVEVQPLKISVRVLSWEHIHGRMDSSYAPTSYERDLRAETET